MSKNIQNLVLLMESFEDASEISLKGGNMFMNRFCIEEDAAFELSDVHYLTKSSGDILGQNRRIKFKQVSKGKGNS